jgi:hypothetical protein
LVEGNGLASSLDNALLGGTGEAKSSDCEFGDRDESDIVCHCADLNNDLGFAISNIGSFGGKS